jgi:hypothetical protein
MCGPGLLITKSTALIGCCLELGDPADQTGRMMSPIRQNDASDSFNEIPTVRIELRDTDPLI